MSAKTVAAGRPATFDRNTAINRAMNLFWLDGYLGVTARDLAKAMNIQRSSFYNSFGSKEQVFTEALQNYVQLAPDAVLDTIKPGQPVIAAIVASLRELCRVRAADKNARGCLVCNSVAELVGVDKKLGPILNDAVKRRIAVMEALFTQACDQNEFVPLTTIPDTARTFVTFSLGINVASKTIRSEAELWSICQTFLPGIGVGKQYLEESVG